jgi:hypothetical protein
MTSAHRASMIGSLKQFWPENKDYHQVWPLYPCALRYPAWASHGCLRLLRGSPPPRCSLAPSARRGRALRPVSMQRAGSQRTPLSPCPPSLPAVLLPSLPASLPPPSLPPSRLRAHRSCPPIRSCPLSLPPLIRCASAGPGVRLLLPAPHAPRRLCPPPRPAP